VSRVEGEVVALNREVFGNGRPSLCDRLRSEFIPRIEQVERHGKANMEQGDGDLEYLIKEGLKNVSDQRKEDKQEWAKERRQDQEKNDERHKDNQEKMKAMQKSIDFLTKVSAGFSGALVLFKILEDTGLIHLPGVVK
jgi:hypothetical protein